jgi:hypothetical protein
LELEGVDTGINSALEDAHEGHCKNCATQLQGEYCHQCGQHHRQYIRSIFAVVGDLFGEIGHWDSRFYRTMTGLFFRPGFLSLEFSRGRHASYVPPLRLYFFVSLVAFLVLSMTFQFDIKAPTNQADAITQIEPGKAGDDGQTEVIVQGFDASKLKLQLPWLSQEEQQALQQRIDYLAQNPSVLAKKLVSLAPQMMLLMLPFWALFLKLVYLFNHRYYLEHLTVAFHTHAFLLLSLMILSVLDLTSDTLSRWLNNPLPEQTINWLETMLLVWMGTYMLFTQKLYYQQGWALTWVKFVVCSLAYSLLLSVTFVAMIIIGIMTA